MLDTSVKSVLHKVKPGNYLYKVFTPWPDETNHQHTNVYFQTTITGRYGKWRVTCIPLQLDAEASTLTEAQKWVDLSVQGIYNHKLENEAVWRNSGGYLCYAGWYGGHHIYCAHNWYGGKWELTASAEGKRDLRVTHANLANALSEIEQAIERQLLSLPPVDPANDTRWLMDDLPF